MSMETDRQDVRANRSGTVRVRQASVAHDDALTMVLPLARSDPHMLSARDVQHLQRTIGNKAVSTLMTGSPHDHQSAKMMRQVSIQRGNGGGGSGGSSSDRRLRAQDLVLPLASIWLAANRTFINQSLTPIRNWAIGQTPYFGRFFSIGRNFHQLIFRSNPLAAAPLLLGLFGAGVAWRAQQRGQRPPRTGTTFE